MANHQSPIIKHQSSSDPEAELEVAIKLSLGEAAAPSSAELRRVRSAGTAADEFTLGDLEYADDTGLLYCSRHWALGKATKWSCLA